MYKVKVSFKNNMEGVILKIVLEEFVKYFLENGGELEFGCVVLYFF